MLRIYVSVAQRFGYGRLNRLDKGIVLRYLQRTSGYSGARLTRLRARVVDGQLLGKRYRVPSHSFVNRFTPGDTLFLAEVDLAHGTMSGPATVHLLRRAFGIYGDVRFERMSSLSVSRLYNLCHSRTYLNQRVSSTKTRPVVNPIGVRRAHKPAGRPGFIRIENRSIRVISMAPRGSITSMRWISSPSKWWWRSCERISKAQLLSVLQDLMDQFPFEILGFHSDNGSEYINKAVATLLVKMRVEQTKSRSRHSNDNALAESKNGSVVGKAFGYSHISSQQTFTARRAIADRYTESSVTKAVGTVKILTI